MVSIIDLCSVMGLIWLFNVYLGFVDVIYFNGGIEGFVIDDLMYECLDVSFVFEFVSVLLLVVGLMLFGCWCFCVVCMEI